MADDHESGHVEAAPAPAPYERRQGPPDTSKMISVKVDNIAYDTRKEELQAVFEVRACALGEGHGGRTGRGGAPSSRLPKCC